jgi:hypothetical protein
MIDTINHYVKYDGSSWPAPSNYRQVRLPLPTEPYRCLTLFTAHSLNQDLIFDENLQDKKTYICVEGRPKRAVRMLEQI